jgi:hypothetical protein
MAGVVVVGLERSQPGLTVMALAPLPVADDDAMAECDSWKALESSLSPGGWKMSRRVKG